MGVMDPSGVQISVSVRTSRGATFQLWMGGSTSGDLASEESIFLDPDAEFQDLPIVTGVNIELLRGYNSTVTIELGAPYNMGLALLESDLFIIGNTFVTSVGYPRIGLFLPPISSFAIKPSITLNPDDGLTATLNGQAGVFAGLRSTSEVVRRNLSIKEAIQEIADLERNRWNIIFPQQQIVASEAPPQDRLPRPSAYSTRVQSDPNDELYAARNSISQAGKTDWAEVVRLCGIAGCKAVVRPETQGSGAMQVVIMRESDSARVDPVYTLVSRGQIDMRIPNGRFPLLSLESEAEGVWFERGSRSTVSNDIDSESGDETGDVEATDESVADQVPNAVTGGITDGATEQDDVNVSMGAGRQRIVSPQSSTEATPQERVNQNTRERSERGAGINVTVSTIGNPLAFPGDRIRLENVGLFSGNYEINGESHQVAEDWMTTMQLIRRGSFETRFISEALRRAQDWDATDQEPPNQGDIQEDAQGGGSILVDPVEVPSSEFDPEALGGI